MPTLRNNWASYRWSLIALLPLMMTAAWDLHQHWPAAEDEHNDISLLEYSNGVLVALVVAVDLHGGAVVHSHAERVPLHFGLGRLEMTAWSLLSHVLVAIIVISILNLIRLVTRHARRPTSLRLGLIGIAIALMIGTVLDRFLASALSFEGWAAYVYAVFFSVTLTLFLGIPGVTVPVTGGRMGTLSTALCRSTLLPITIGLCRSGARIADLN